MNAESLKEECRRFMAGELDQVQFLSRCLATAAEQNDHGTIDLDRVARCGFPEVVFAEGKSHEALRQAIETLRDAGQIVLATRVSAEQAEALREWFPAARYNNVARTLRLPDPPSERTACGQVAVITAGTSDRPVAEEAWETLDCMGVSVVSIHDVGVAGPYRFPSHLDQLREIDAAVVVAGMEGALPSVAGGYLSCPVIAVPTSIGYGASLNGLAALLGMLNSCAANVTVVNIDAGFKAGYVAGLIARRRHDV